MWRCSCFREAAFDEICTDDKLSIPVSRRLATYNDDRVRSVMRSRVKTMWLNQRVAEIAVYVMRHRPLRAVHSPVLSRSHSWKDDPVN